MFARSRSPFITPGPSIVDRCRFLFRRGMHTGGFLDYCTNAIFTDFGKRETASTGSEERKQLELVLAEYKCDGPPGSLTPQFPVDITHLEQTLTGNDNAMRTAWKRTSLYNWAKSICAEPNPYNPCKLGDWELGRALLHGGKCAGRIARRVGPMRKLGKFRRELRNARHKMKGVGYGMTVGVNLYIDRIMRFEVAIIPYVYPRNKCEIG